MAMSHLAAAADPGTGRESQGLKAWLATRFELNRGGPGKNTRPMEGLRGMAVFLVFLVHYCSLAAPRIDAHSLTGQIGHALHTLGNAGVDLFFVLSGLLIYGSIISREQGFARFMGRRIERIYPTFLALFLLYLLMSWLFPAESKIPRDPLAAGTWLVANLLLLPGIFPIEPMITVAWSLSYEMFFYLLIPLLVGASGMRGWSAQQRIRFFSLLALAMFALSCLNSQWVRMTMFVAGILLHEHLRLPDRRSPGTAVVVLLALGGWLAALLPYTGFGAVSLKTALMFIGFYALCLGCFQGRTGTLSAFFSWTPIRWLGNISYSYYLLHGLALKACFFILDRLMPATPFSIPQYWGLMAGCFLVTVLCSAVLFLTIERPLSLDPAARRGQDKRLGSSATA